MLSRGFCNSLSKKHLKKLVTMQVTLPLAGFPGVTYSLLGISGSPELESSFPLFPPRTGPTHKYNRKTLALLCQSIKTDCFKKDACCTHAGVSRLQVFPGVRYSGMGLLLISLLPAPPKFHRNRWCGTKEGRFRHSPTPGFIIPCCSLNEQHYSHC